MKTLKYVAIIAASVLTCASYAQENAAAKAAPEQAPIVVKATNNKGVPTYEIVINPSAEKLNTEEAIKQALKAAMANVDPDSVNAKAINASLLVIKAALADKYEPVTSPVQIKIEIKNRVEGANNIAVVSTVVSMNGDKYEANTETSFNPETKVAQTNGNVITTNQQGVASPAAPVSVAMNNDGEIVGSIGNATVTDTVVTSSQETTVPTETTSQQEAETTENVIPDSTVVTSATK